jgi:signal transduction histidine kinase
MGFKPLAEQKKIHFSVHLPHKPVMAYADKEVLTKILSNLLSNAIKYAHKEARVSLAVDAKTKSFFIEADNDGPVIPDDMQEKIFEPFVRLKGTEKQRGTGIGLALARSLAVLHQGTLTIQVFDGTFNRFVLHLPMLDSRASMQPAQSNAEPKISAPIS